MENKYCLANQQLEIWVKKAGAELCSIKLLCNDTQYMWDANPMVWAAFSPVLFPIVGALKDDSYFYRGKMYFLPRHGFARGNQDFKLIEKTDNSLTLRLRYNAGTLKCFPFCFELDVTYTLVNNSINVTFEVKNTGEDVMLFSLGGHPAFRCPIGANEKYSDYRLEFGQNETAHTYKIETGGLIGEKSDVMLNGSNTINLHYNLFDKGALVFKNLKSEKIRLISSISGKRVELNYKGFPYLGIWALPNANFVCLEPWHGIADNNNTNQVFEKKEGLIRLLQGNLFNASYTISIF